MLALDEKESSAGAHAGPGWLLHLGGSSHALARERSVVCAAPPRRDKTSVRQRSRRSASGGEAARGLSLSSKDAACPPKPRTVLVVEDDDVTRAFLLDNRAADGFPGRGRQRGGEGLRAMEVRQPALVVPRPPAGRRQRPRPARPRPGLGRALVAHRSRRPGDRAQRPRGRRRPRPQLRPWS
jgi:hypothetical protein